MELSAQVAEAIAHPALIPVERIIDTDEGVVTVSAWFDGELLRAPAELRNDPEQLVTVDIPVRHSTRTDR